MSETTTLAATPASRPSQTLPVKVATGGRAEGADQHLAFEADVDDARALRPQAGETGEDQRHRRA